MSEKIGRQRGAEDEHKNKDREGAPVCSIFYTCFSLFAVLLFLRVFLWFSDVFSGLSPFFMFYAFPLLFMLPFLFWNADTLSF